MNDILAKLELQEFINIFLSKTIEDFRTEIQRLGKGCEIKNFDYEKGLPDYNKPIIQQYYLLRYFYAYLLEYISIYDNLLDSAHIRTYDLKVLSMGCGCGLDYYGLCYAIKKNLNSPTYTTKYIGFDSVSWNYRFSLGNQYHQINNDDILTLHSFPGEINCYIFPKSISEFSEEEFEKLKNIWKLTSFSSSKIAIIGSVRKEKKDLDEFRLIELVNSLRVFKNFRQDSHTSYSFDNNHYLSEYYEVAYPENIKTQIKDVLKMCPTYLQNGKSCEKQNCEQKLLQKYPILRSSHMNFSIFLLSRNDN